MASDSIRAALDEAIRHHQAGRLIEARRLYERILAADPDHPDALNLLGMIEHAGGDTTRAIGLVERAIACNPQVPGFHTNLGTLRQSRGESQAAAGAFLQALALKPDHLPALYNLGVTLQASGRFQEAADRYSAALTLNSRLPDALNNLGMCQVQLGDPVSALESFNAAAAVDFRFTPARINAAGLLFKLGRYEEAERLYRSTLAARPDHVEARYNLGLVLMKRGSVQEAAVAFRAALSADPDHAGAALHLANALFEAGDHKGAIAAFRSLASREPELGSVRLALAIATIPVMAASAAASARIPEDFARAVGELERWASSHPGALANAAGTAQPFLLAYRPSDLTATLARYGRLLSDHAAAAGAPGTVEAPALGGRARVRLGIVSGQVHAHPVWQVILRGIIAQIDRRRFDVRLYDTGVVRDGEGDWAHAHVDHHQRHPLTTSGWVDHLRADGPDVLFYPEVGMDSVSGALAPLRLARLQIASWGHPVTTGLPSMDLFVSGEAIEPPDADAHYTERLVRLPGTGVLTRFGELQASRWSGPDRRSGVVRFALCQQPMKFDPKDDDLLARIAEAVGPSEFWLVRSNKHPWASDFLIDRLSSAFAARGLDPSRHLRMARWMGPAEFLGFLDEMDVMLDCPAFSGYTTAWQATHRGTPVVTLEGRFLRQRLAAGLLRQIGCDASIAGTEANYLSLAADHARRSRVDAGRQQRRAGLAEAARRADGNVDAIRAFERILLSG